MVHFLRIQAFWMTSRIFINFLELWCHPHAKLFTHFYTKKQGRNQKGTHGKIKENRLFFIHRHTETDTTVEEYKNIHTLLLWQMALSTFLQQISSTVFLYSSTPLTLTLTRNTCGKIVAWFCPTTNVLSASTCRNLAISKDAGEQSADRRETVKPRIRTGLSCFAYKTKWKLHFQGFCSRSTLIYLLMHYNPSLYNVSVASYPMLPCEFQTAYITCRRLSISQFIDIPQQFIKIWL